jgi:dihydrofolate reductase
MINIIVACNRRGGIGFKNTIPWCLKGDMRYFKNLTEGTGNNSVIMGKNTWFSLPEKFKPLPNRSNIILSSTLENREINNNNVYIARTIDEVIDYCKYKNFDTNWVIGGSMLYASFLDSKKVKKIYKTEIETDAICDTYFPRYDDYILSHSSKKMKENNIEYTFKTFIKQKENEYLMRAHTGMF